MERFLNEFPIQKIDIASQEYPELLKQTTDAPQILYFRGNFHIKNNCFAIVGTRRASDYGKEIAFSFAKQLCQAGLTIVSGMAVGIDSWSHKGAIETYRPQGSVNFCPTIAILGTGLDEPSIYPQENLGLAKQILEKNGCLLSEYPAGTNATNFTFPQRNRIIAGLSLGTLVVEAKIKSGALITADFAKKYSRKIFAVPGNIHNQNSQGCHWLIKQGAKLTENTNDILQMLGITQTIKTQMQRGTNATETLILQILQNGSQHIEKIIEQTKLPSPVISSALSMMEIDDKIRSLGGNVYSLNF